MIDPSFSPKLGHWFTAHGRHTLPWRKTPITPYKVWVSEIMLQQTQVSRVISYYERFLQRFPTIQDLANSSWEDFLPYYQGLGYYSRGRNMLKTAQMIVQDFGGKFPQNYDDLRKLPGVGHYTALAILGFGFGHKVLAPDTNVQRVLGRYIQGNKKALLDMKVLENELKSQGSLPQMSAILMDFANTVCTRKPQCSVCPLASQCVYAQTQGNLEEALVKKLEKFPATQAQTFLFLHENHKKYFSLSSQTFAPFILPEPINTRHRIQEYFLRNYGLNLAVRPPYRKDFVNEVPTLWTRAQILSGSHVFSTYSKKDAQDWEENAGSL